jgi:hypothetical protein
MKCTVFYSWQSQLPEPTNQTFIHDALEAATARVREDVTIEARPQLDRDTANVPGAPIIFETLLAKIDAAEVVVCDVSIVQGQAGGAERATPNPNVLIELGYALKSLGSHERVVLVMNTAFGDVDLLPFDLRGRRVTKYSLKPGGNEYEERERLTSVFEATLREVLARPSRQFKPSSLVEQAIDAVEAAAPHAEVRVKKAVGALVQGLRDSKPDIRVPLEHDQLIEALGKTVGAVADYARLADAAVGMNALGSARALYDGLAPLVEDYDTPRGFEGRFDQSAFDYARFLGHELLVAFAMAVIAHERWELLDDVFRREFFVRQGREDRALPFTRALERVKMFANRTRQGADRRLSVHADFLKKRHEDGLLGRVLPFDRFIDADVLLFLRSELVQPPVAGSWHPWSVIYLEHRVPPYLTKGEERTYAAGLLKAFGCPSIEELRAGYEKKRPQWGTYYREAFTPPLTLLDLSKLATR